MSNRLTAKKRPYTDAELCRFDEITEMLSSPHQMTRIEARFRLVPEFVAKHGREKCDLMFAELQRRDIKKRRGKYA